MLRSSGETLVVLQQPLGYLNSVKSGTLADLVAHKPESDAVGVGQIFTHTAYIDIVATLRPLPCLTASWNSATPTGRSVSAQTASL